MSGWSRFVVTVFLLFWSFLTVVVCLEPLSLFGTPIVSLEVVFFFNKILSTYQKNVARELLNLVYCLVGIK